MGLSGLVEKELVSHALLVQRLATLVLEAFARLDPSGAAH